MWQKLDWFPQCPVQMPSGVFSCTGGWKTNHVPRFVSRERPQSDALLQDLSLALSGVLGGWGGGRQRVTRCADVNCGGDGRVLKPSASGGAF